MCEKTRATKGVSRDRILKQAVEAIEHAGETALRVDEFETGVDACRTAANYTDPVLAILRRNFSDAKIYTIFEGTSEIQQLVIARAISGLRVE